MSTCDTCDGAGYVERAEAIQGRPTTITVACDPCQGTGLMLSRFESASVPQSWSGE